MRAVGYSAFGAAADVLKLTEFDTPTPQAGEVLVRLHLSGVNPSDVKARAGARPGVTKPAFPTIIPHSDGAGVIDAVGAGVDPSRIGERVWVWNGQWQRAFGTAAEYICLPSDQAQSLPDRASYEVGATLGIPGFTAVHTVLGNGLVEGKTLLVSGGAGMVGHLAVQTAIASGAFVVATGSAGDLDEIRSHGADCAVDYRSPTLAQDILDATGGRLIEHAVEVEFGQNIHTLAEVMAPNGRIVTYGSAKQMAPELPFGPLLFKAITVEIALIYLLSGAQRANAIENMMRLLETGALRPKIGPIFDLNDCAKAHEAVEMGARSGAVLVRTA